MFEERPFLVEALRAYGKPATPEAFKDIVGKALPELEGERLNELIATLKEDGTLVRTGSRRLALPEQVGLNRGLLKRSERGFAFFIPEDGTPDLYIPPDSLAGAHNSDKVLVRKTGGKHVKKSGDNDCAQVVRVIERANKRVVGRLERAEQRAQLLFVPCDKRVSDVISVPKKWQSGAKAGDAVVLEIRDYDKLIGKVAQVLPKGSDVEAMALMNQYGVEDEFPKAVADEAARVPQKLAAGELIRREDLRSRLIVTIDGADAKDLDDAISLEKLGAGRYLLGVHIADVGHYVGVGSNIDKEAYARATSVYFPNFVAPMLPQELSNGICSLHGGVDRLTLSCFMEVDRGGNVVDYRFSETVINSGARLTYDEVSEFLETGETELKKPVKKLLKDMESLYAILRKRRAKEGSIDFATSDTKIRMLDGIPVGVERSEYGVANGIIEEFMLLCNKTVAKHMDALHLPCLYRVHESPDAAKLDDFMEFMKNVGLPLKKPKKLTPKLLQSALDKAKDTPEEYVISKMLLRLMKKARYSEENLSHFGLSFEHYAHFTSPIRRYPDLVVHRVLKLWMHGRLSGETLAALNARMADMAHRCSEREKNAEEAERAMTDLRKCQYMSAKVGEGFKGIVSGMSNAGIFVELPNSVEGMIPFASIHSDYFTYDPKRMIAVGERTKRVFRFGEQLSVKVGGVDLSSRRVEFQLESGVRERRTYRHKARGMV